MYDDFEHLYIPKNFPEKIFLCFDRKFALRRRYMTSQVCNVAAKKVGHARSSLTFIFGGILHGRCIFASVKIKPLTYSPTPTFSSYSNLLKLIKMFEVRQNTRVRFEGECKSTRYVLEGDQHSFNLESHVLHSHAGRELDYSDVRTQMPKNQKQNIFRTCFAVSFKKKRKSTEQLWAHFSWFHIGNTLDQQIVPGRETQNLFFCVK